MVDILDPLVCIRTALDEGATPVVAAAEALRQHPADTLRLSAMLSLASAFPAIVDQIRLGSTTDGPPGLDAGIAGWLAVFGHSDQDGPDPAVGPLEPFAHRADPWPLVVSLPLDRLVDAQRAAQGPKAPQWARAYLSLRDAAEGVARLLWVLLVHDTFHLLHNEPNILHEGSDADRNALQATLASIRHGFSFGTCTFLAGQGAWHPWTDPSRRDRPSAAAAATLRAWQPPLGNLQQWRNLDLGHGLVGEEQRLCRLFDPEADGHTPVLALANLLTTLEPHLPAWQRTL